MGISPVGLMLMLGFAAGVPAEGARPGGDPRCAADLDSLQVVVGRDYAGFRTKAAARAAALAAVADSVRAAVLAAGDPSACTAALQRWVSFFGDPHLQLWEPGPSGQGGSSERSGNAAAGDPRRPSLEFPDDSAAVLRLPDFADRYKPAIDSLIAAHRGRLLSTPHLVIDVRRNGGGWTGSYERSVLPLLYTDPILVDGMEAWASEGNIAYMRQMLASDRAEGIKRVIRTLLPKLEASREQFVTVVEDREIRLDTVHPMPRAVAVLIGRGCASTCEQFVLDARQSRKVTVMGSQNTGGFLDYGNVRRVQLPSGTRVVQIPTSRSKRLPENPMDVVGIAPQLRIPESEVDPVGFALRYLRANGR